LSSLVLGSAARAVPAFPGAEGFGANAKGARASASPTVYRVTNLNDSGAGSLRDAVSTSGRVVVFDVGGIIRVGSPIVFASNLTIAGQTAPGGGVTLYGNRVSFSGANNTICRYLRFRMGIDGDDGADAVGIANGSDMIFDHVSASWGRDETFSISGDAAVRITLQDCLIAQGLRIHSAGGLMQTSGGVSIFRTLYADNYMRNPKIKGVNDYVNNVVYNWGSGGGYIPAGDSAGDSFANMIGCYFIGGPESGVGRSPFSSGNTKYRLFQSGNLEDLDLDGTLDGVPVGSARFPTLQLVGTRFAYPASTTELSAPAALAWVLDRAGASHRRDRTDDYVVAEVRSYGTSGVFIYDEAEMGGLGTVAAGLKVPDTDNDGMPDWWELAAATNPVVADATVLGADGYLNIERYLNALVVGGVPGAFIDGITSDTGASASDGITSGRTLVLRGTAPVGSTVSLARADLGVLGTVVADGNGQWTYDYSATSLADRVYAFTATATVGGVLTPPSPALVVRIDTVAAPAPAITGLSLAPVAAVSGTATPGDTVAVTLAGQVVATGTADELGNWTAPYIGPALGAGQKTFTAAATDLAGNPGPASGAYVVDTGLAAPVFTAISTDSGASASDRLTNDATLVLSGNAPSGATVNVTRAGVGVVGSAVATGGAFSFSYAATTLPAGAHTFTATATLAGSASPVSAPFVATIDTTAPAIASLRRLTPATYSTNGGSVVYRVTFAEPVTGVDLVDFTLTRSGTTGSLASVATVSSTVYDVTAVNLSGDGTARLDLNASGTGILDLAGNAVSGGYTAGQAYTVRLAGSGVWINLDNDGLWSDSANWDGGLLAGATGATADFGLRDLVANTTLILDSNRTLGRIVFGDTDFSTPAGWTVSDGGVLSRVITLEGTSTPVIQVDAGTTPAGDTTDVPAANATPHRLAVALAGGKGFTKTGVGTLELNRPNPALAGALTISKGIVQVGPGGTLAPASVNIATSQQLRVTGGTFTTAGNVSWTSGTGTGVIVSGGTASFQNIVPTNARNSFFRVTGGMVAAKDLNFPRSGDSEAQTSGTGVLISGGETTFANIGLGTGDSWAGMTISGGKLTVTGTLHNGYQKTAGRGGVIYLSGGELAVTGATNGLVMARNPGGTNANTNNVAKLIITGGAANLAKLTLGYDATVSAGSASVTVSTGELNLGAGGIVKNGAAGLASSLSFASGTLGALADWSTTHPLSITDTSATPLFSIRAARPDGTPHDITLNGVVSGAGGFNKTGGGTLTLSAANAVTGNINVNAGTLNLTGTLAAAAGRSLVVNAGGTLAGTGTSNLTLGLFAGGTVSPGGNAAGTLTVAGARISGGSTLRFNLGAGGDQLVIPGGFTYFGSGPVTFAFTPGTLAVGTPYTLITTPGGTPGITTANLAFTGLGYGKGHFTIGTSGIQFTLDDDGVALTPFYDWLTGRGLAADPAAATGDPDADGVATLLEFVFGQDPSLPDVAQILATTIVSNQETYPAVSYRRRRARGGVSVAVEAARDPTFASPLTLVDVSAPPEPDGFDRVLVRSALPISTETRQFFRVRASLP
jgi:autotransporter-associated beta strand protein